MASDSEHGKFFEALRGLSRGHNSGDQTFFLLQFQYKKIANCNTASMKKSSVQLITEIVVH